MASSVISEANHDNEKRSGETVIDSGNAYTPSEKITVDSEGDNRTGNSLTSMSNTDPTNHGGHQAGTGPVHHIHRHLESETRLSPPRVAGQDQLEKEHTKEPTKVVSGSDSECQLTSPHDANIEHSIKSGEPSQASEVESGLLLSDATQKLKKSRVRDESSQKATDGNIGLPTLRVDQEKNTESPQMDSKSEGSSSIDEEDKKSSNETELEAPVLELEETCEAVPETSTEFEASFSTDILQNLSSGVSKSIALQAPGASLLGL